MIQALGVVEPNTDTSPQVSVHAQYQSERKGRGTNRPKMNELVGLVELGAHLEPKLVPPATQKCQFLSTTLSH
jgi:hypothetical protein